MSFGVAPSLPRGFVAAMDLAPVGIRFGSCSAAVYLSRQVTVADIETDAFWEYRREAAQHAGLRAAWSAPIVASDGQGGRHLRRLSAPARSCRWPAITS